MSLRFLAMVRRASLDPSGPTMRVRGVAIAFVSYFILHTSYLLSGCQYTIDGNSDIDLVEVHVSPIAAVVPTNGRLALSASVLGFSHTGTVTWSVEGSGNGMIAANGLIAIYTADSALTSFPMVVNVRVTSDENPNRSVICPVSIINPPVTAYSVSPHSVTLLTNNMQQFSIDSITSLSPIPSVRWTIISGPGAISDSGLFTPPAAISHDSVQTVIRAVSLADNTVYSEAVITLLNSSDSLLCFTRDILPVLSASCGASGCHDANTSKAGYNYLTYSGTLPSVRTGDARSSRLYTAITQFDANTRMPPAPQPPLAPNQVLKIGEWIDEGAHNDCP